MRIAVLGATGVGGCAFVSMARAAGYTLTVRRTDVFDQAGLQALFEGCEAVVNLATSIPKAGGRGSWAANDRIRREGTVNVLRACTQTGVRVLLQQSIAMLHCVSDERAQDEKNPIEGYGVITSAFDMEVLARAAALDVRIVRGGLLYGPGATYPALWLADTRNPVFQIPGDGGGYVSPVHVDDYATALIEVLMRGASGQAYIACDDAPLKLSEIYARAAMKVGVDPPGTGGPQYLRSFRVSNAKLRALGWTPLHPTIQF